MQIKFIGVINFEEEKSSKLNNVNKEYVIANPSIPSIKLMELTIKIKTKTVVSWAIK